MGALVLYNSISVFESRGLSIGLRRRKFTRHGVVFPLVYGPWQPDEDGAADAFNVYLGLVSLEQVHV